jgi:hypothetical protein
MTAKDVTKAAVKKQGKEKSKETSITASRRQTPTPYVVHLSLP